MFIRPRATHRHYNQCCYNVTYTAFQLLAFSVMMLHISYRITFQPSNDCYVKYQDKSAEWNHAKFAPLLFTFWIADWYFAHHVQLLSCQNLKYFEHFLTSNKHNLGMTFANLHTYRGRGVVYCISYCLQLFALTGLQTNLP